jgi:alkylmercury lyase
MAANPFATKIADTLFAPAAHNGTNLMGTAMRLLTHGKPITVEELAETAGATVADVANAPAAADIEYDEQHRILGWGLTLNPTPHRFTVDGQLLYTWCAADTLLFPAIIGRPAHVESPCPATGTTIRLAVDPETGVTDLDPSAAVLSVPGPDEVDPARVRATTCNPGRFFANAHAAAEWQTQHPTGFVLPVTDGYHQLRPISDRVLDGTGKPDRR